MKDTAKRIEPIKTKIKFLEGNQMGVKKGAAVTVNTSYAKLCVEKGWGEVVTGTPK
jgi:hypothetical protein